MGRRSSRGRRDVSTIASVPQTLSSLITPSTVVFDTYEDRRRYHPEGDDSPPLSFSGRPAPFVRKTPVRSTPGTFQVVRGPDGRPMRVRGPRQVFFGKEVYAFQTPKSVWVCARRKMRKEVLHALKIAGRGGRKRHHRRSWISEIRCK